MDPALCLFDAVLIFGSYTAVMILRFDGNVPQQWRSGFFNFVIFVLVLHLASNWAFGLYRQMWRHASVNEAQRVVQAGAVAGVLILVVYLLDNRPVPLSVAVLGVFVATILMGALRFQSRLFSFHRRSNDLPGMRVVIVGAGEAGASIIREMQRRPGLIPVAILDDDCSKVGLALLGVPVVGDTTQLVDTVRRFDAHRVVLAIRSAGHALVTRVASDAEVVEVPLQILPGFGDVVRGRASLRDVRDLSIEDLIGRDEVKIDVEAVRSMLRGRRVLVTGGGGSIGTEIGRQVAACEPAELVLLDHDETHLHDAEARIDQPVVLALADVRDEVRIRSIFARHRPEVVFHAAAHKHVPILEAQASEAAETNVLGTERIVAAAEDFGVEILVFISTDKAVRPSSVMGASKRLGEQLVLSRGSHGKRFSAVRFGNVLGSRGSVIPTFGRQIALGGPVTVTDERMTRYFMTIEEAVQLVLQAAVFSSGGEIFMLEMGRAVNIMELAKRMIRLSGLRPGSDIEIKVTGVRPGEKLEEELAAPEELKNPTDHHAIVRLEVEPAPAARLGAMLRDLRRVSERKDDRQASHLLFVYAGSSTSPLLEVEIDLREPELEIDLRDVAIDLDTAPREASARQASL
ncbi:MAG: nucleoside-diphosphate sugar epimerase/dehydratase [Mycetocola sp.]